MEGENRADRVTLCADGKYRWIYEYPMMKKPAILFTIWKVLAIAGLVPALITAVSGIAQEGINALLTGLKIYAVTVLITGLLSVIGYTIVAAVYGWKYVVVFEMNDEGILHAQQGKQFTKAQAMGMLIALAGENAGNPQITGAGLLSATRSSIMTTFSKVRKVKGNRRQDTIKVNEPFAKNQVYVRDEDYDFVWNYITARCDKAVVTD